MAQQHWDEVITAMEEVVATGTGGRSRVPGVRVAGKTGTAQNPHGDDHALFVAFAPVEAPRIAIAVIIENSGHGGSVAAPIAQRGLMTYLRPDLLDGASAGEPLAGTAEADGTGVPAAEEN
jgi:penicillin-binding protein 2